MVVVLFLDSVVVRLDFLDEPDSEGVRLDYLDVACFLVVVHLLRVDLLDVIVVACFLVDLRRSMDVLLVHFTEEHRHHLPCSSCEGAGRLLLSN